MQEVDYWRLLLKRCLRPESLGWGGSSIRGLEPRRPFWKKLSTSVCLFFFQTGWTRTEVRGRALLLFTSSVYSNTVSSRTLAMEKLLQRIEAGTRLPNHFVVETNQEFFLFVFDETVVVANDSRHSQIILSCAKCDCAREKRRKSHSDAIVIACWRERPDVFPSWAKREKQRDVYQGKRILLQPVRVCVSVSPAVD